MCILGASLASGCQTRTHPHVNTWGDGPPNRDAEISRLIITSTDGVRSTDMNADLLAVIVERVDARPELLQQLFKDYRQYCGTAPPCDDSSWFIIRIYTDTTSHVGQGNRQALDILLFASFYNMPGWVSGLTWNDVPKRWLEVRNWIHTHMYFTVYCHGRGVFVVDGNALCSQIRVTPSRQSWAKCDSETAIPDVDARTGTDTKHCRSDASSTSG